MIPRFYEDLEKYIDPNKVLVIYGSRQVGKTTLLNNYLSRTKLKYKLDSGDNIKIQEILSSENFEKIIEYASGYELLAIDEAQKIPKIGLGLKILVDQIPGIKIIATGSSSFELAGQVGEPLTGRKRTITLYPLSQIELAKLYNPYELKEKLKDFLIFGSYPDVLNAKTKIEKIKVLEELINSYLLKDILDLKKVKSSKILRNLLLLIAFQIGKEVSLTELGTKLGLDYKTVAKYLDLLEKSFIIYNLIGFSRNLRKEITKNSRYYFYDNGIRNALINNFNSIDLRDDVGMLWENYIITERIKKQTYNKIFSNNYFWRTYDKKEIDWIEEREGKLFGYEIKWTKDKTKIPQEWLKTYSEATFQVINKENYLDFIG